MPLDNWPTLNGIRLPAFPCKLDKKPLTTHGYKDATLREETFKYLLDKYTKLNDDIREFLFGVPTGEASGFDVLDIDPEGMEWYGNNYGPLVTRYNKTKRDGFHFLFNHHPGLRNSASKIAPGVDVRSNGGYVIWWPSQLLPFNNIPIIDWPLGILAQLEQNNQNSLPSMATHSIPAAEFGTRVEVWKSFDECEKLLSINETDEEIIKEILDRLLGIPGVAIEGEYFLVERYSRESKYAVKSAVYTMNRISSARKGSRNSILNIEAFSLGRIMARRWTTKQKLIRALWRGALGCYLVRDDGVEQTINTIISGLAAGLKDPYPNI